MITVKIDNSELEQQLLKLVANQKKEVEEIAVQAIKAFIDTWQENKLHYKKKDVTQFSHRIQRDDDSILDAEVKPYAHVDDSAAYVKALRNKRSL